MTRRCTEVSVAPSILVPGQPLPSMFALLQTTRLPSGQVRRLQHHDLVQAQRAAGRALSRQQLTTLRLIRVTAVAEDEWDAALAAVTSVGRSR